jgi:hypothetical protein
VNRDEVGLVALWFITLVGWCAVVLPVTDWHFPHTAGEWIGAACGVLFIVGFAVWLPSARLHRRRPRRWGYHPQHTIRISRSEVDR